MRGLSCLYVYHNMSICVCQVSVCHSMSRWLMTFLDIKMYQSMFVCLAFHCFQCQQISGNKHLMHVTKTGNLTHPTQKNMTSLWKRQQFYIVFLIFFEIFNVMKICSKTHFLVYKLSLCFFLGGWQKSPEVWKSSGIFTPQKSPEIRDGFHDTSRRYREFLPVLRRIPRGFGDTERRVEP